MKAIVIPTSASEKPYIVEFTSNEEINMYHKEIGCALIDAVSLARYGRYFVDAVVSDCGRIDGSEVNERFATAHANGCCAYPLYGKVVITSTDFLSGATIDLREIDIIKTFKRLGFDESDMEIFC